MDVKRNFVEETERRIARAEAWISCAKALSSTQPAVKAKDMTEINKAFVELDDYSTRFVFWWIAFESLSSQREDSGIRQTKSFIRELMLVPGCKEQLKNALAKHRQAASKIVRLPQTHDGFWINRTYKNKKGEERRYASCEEWKNAFDEQKKKYRSKDTDLQDKLEVLFDRLRVTRNQIFHGANSRASGRGISQVQCGAELLEEFIPIFKQGMKDCLTRDWGEIPFPRVGKGPDDLKVLPVWAAGEEK